MHERGEIMKRIFIAALVVLAIGVAGCSGGTASIDALDGAGVDMPDGDASNPFEIEPSDEIDDDVEVEAGDVEVEAGDLEAGDEGDGYEQVELLTDVEDIDTDAEFGEGSSYSQLFEVANYGAEYEWDVGGLPAGTGLALVEVTGSGSKVRLEGEPTGLDLGTHQITVTVWDAADPSNEDSISFALEVVSVYEPQSVIEDLPKGPCGEPLTVEVVKLGNYSDPDILQAGEATYEIGEIVEIEVKARRGDGLPVGKVKWEVTSEVEDSEHCFFGTDTIDADGNILPVDYNYSWVRDGSCIAWGTFTVEAVDDEIKTVKKTTNPFWQTRELRDASLKIAGIFSYDGPLPVRDLPLDQDAVERLKVTVRDECSNSGASRTAQKTFKFRIAYPDRVDSDGGAMTDIAAHLEYTDVDHYSPSGFGVWGNGFSVVFTDSNGLSDHARNQAEVGLLGTAHMESVGWIHYNFWSCDQGHENCDEKMILKGGAMSSVLDASRVYLLWVAPAPVYMGVKDKEYLDFNIHEITFKNRYWDAKFEDDEDDFNDNIMTAFTRLDSIWQFDGMSERGYRFSDNPNVRTVFRRRELAGWAPLPNQ